ncbi:MAG: class I tRNA ligase family protein [Phycisphaerales bacterium]
MPPFYITTPIYYVNDRPHIGHCYTTLLADVAARFQRLVRGTTQHSEPSTQGPSPSGGTGVPPVSSSSGGTGAPPVFFLTGTDEHAEKVVTTAAQRGLTPIQWADRNSAEFQTVFLELGFSFDDFIRTTQPRHTAAVAGYLRQLLATGDVAEGEFEGWYDVDDEAYVTETKAKEQDYKASNGKPLVRRKEHNFYFKLSAYQPWLQQTISSGKLRIEPEARRNEVLGRLREGLQDVPITRPVTDDPATQFGIRMPGHESHRVYVWIDALFNYLSAVDTPERHHLWPPAAHLMGKEILWFHAVIWPAILKALKRPLPTLIYAHSHYTRDGKKMSKSLGNFVDLETIRAYTGRFGVDALRWYLLTQGPLHATDADFSHAKFVEVYNADLANGIGNCASRVGNMIEKYFEGSLPKRPSWIVNAWLHGNFVPGLDGEMGVALAARAKAGKPVAPEMASVSFDLGDACKDAVQDLIREPTGYLNRVGPQLRSLIDEVDEFISHTAPFTLAKNATVGSRERDALAAILFGCAETIRVVSLLAFPAMPSKMADLWRRWNCTPPPGVPLAELAQWGGPHSLKPGTRIEKGDALFMRADPAEPAPS